MEWYILLTWNNVSLVLIEIINTANVNITPKERALSLQLWSQQ